MNEWKTHGTCRRQERGVVATTREGIGLRVSILHREANAACLTVNTRITITAYYTPTHMLMKVTRRINSSASADPAFAFARNDAKIPKDSKCYLVHISMCMMQIFKQWKHLRRTGPFLGHREKKEVTSNIGCANSYR